MPRSAREGRGAAFRTAAGASLLVLPVLAALGLWLLRDRLGISERLAGGEAGVRRALAGLDRERLGAAPGAPPLELDLFPVRFADVTASFEGGRATVVAMVEAEGRATFDGQSPSVSYIGREVFHMRPCQASWCPEPDRLSRLRGVLGALRARQEALAAAAPGRRVRAWQIRVERERAEVGEDLEVPGDGGTPRRERATLALRWDRGRWAAAP